MIRAAMGSSGRPDFPPTVNCAITLMRCAFRASAPRGAQEFISVQQHRQLAGRGLTPSIQARAAAGAFFQPIVTGNKRVSPSGIAARGLR